jgi:2-desacetyl-2-hydroxyethyl bacteriochlorophyllide A dehydrogenase
MTTTLPLTAWRTSGSEALAEDMDTLVFSAPGVVSPTVVAVPAPTSGRALVQVAYVGICGTDTHLLSGNSPYVQSGLTKYPIRFGHEYSGTVVAVADDCDVDLLGARVAGDAIVGCGHCLTCKNGRYNLCAMRDEIGVKGCFPGAASQYFSVPVANIHRVPESMSLAHAVIAEPSVTALNALSAGDLRIGSRVAVIGTGTLGLIAVQLAVHAGCDVTVIGVEEPGLQAAAELGAVAAVRPEDAPEACADVVLEMSGARSIGPLMTRIAATGARIVQVGIAPGPVEGLSTSEFTAKGLRLSGVLGGVHLVPTALRLIAKGHIQPESLIGDVIDYRESETAFIKLAEPNRKKPKVLLNFSG